MANGINPFTTQLGDIPTETEEDRIKREDRERKEKARRMREEWDVSELRDLDLEASSNEFETPVFDPHAEEQLRRLPEKLSEPLAPREAAELTPDEVGDRLPPWDDKPKKRREESDFVKAWEAKAKKNAQRAEVRAAAKLAGMERLLAAARKKHPKPGGLERGLAMLTGGITGAATGMFDRKRAAAQAEKDVRESFETEWERGQDWKTERGRQKLQSGLIQSRAEATANRSSAEKAVTAMAQAGLTDMQPWVLRNFKKPSDVAFVEDAFKSAVLDFNAVGTIEDRQKAQISNMKNLGKLGYFQTWSNQPPKAIIPSWQPLVDLTFRDARAGQESEQLAAAGKKTDTALSAQEQYNPILTPIVSRVFGIEKSNEPDSDWARIFEPISNRITDPAVGEDLVKSLEKTEGLQLLALSALSFDLVGDKEKETLKKFMGEWEGANLVKRSEAFTNAKTLEEMLDGIGFESSGLDQMDKNMDRIFRLRKELAEAKKNHPEVDGKRSDEVVAASNRLSLATSLTFSNWKMKEVVGKDGEITYESVETKPKPYSIRTIPFANGISISYVVDPEFRENATPKELAKMEAEAEAEIGRFIKAGGNVNWVSKLGGQGGGKIDSGAKARAEAHIASLTPAQLKATTDAMERYKKVGKRGLTLEELNLIFDLQPLLESPDK